MLALDVPMYDILQWVPDETQPDTSDFCKAGLRVAVHFSCVALQGAQ